MQKAESSLLSAAPTMTTNGRTNPAFQPEFSEQPATRPALEAIWRGLADSRLTGVPGKVRFCTWLLHEPPSGPCTRCTAWPLIWLSGVCHQPARKRPDPTRQHRNAPAVMTARILSDSQTTRHARRQETGEKSPLRHQPERSVSSERPWRIREIWNAICLPAIMGLGELEINLDRLHHTSKPTTRPPLHQPPHKPPPNAQIGPLRLSTPGAGRGKNRRRNGLA